MPITWDAEMDRKLFLAIMKVHDISVDKSAVAQELSTDDQPCTPVAVQKRLQKIKEQIKRGGGDAANGDGVETPKSKGKGSGRKRAATTATAAADDEEETPTKKAKGKGGKAKKATAETEVESGDGEEAVVKEEPGDGDDA